jgi:hypothetical protein
MTQSIRHTLFFATVCLVTCFGVFVVPFFLPAGPISAVSISNDAGFNNKLAAVAAGLCSAAVLGLSFLFPQSIGGLPSWKKSSDVQGLPWRVWIVTALLVGGVVGVAGWLILISGARYDADVGYFLNQMSSYSVSHRQLYTQIEFPYGPLLFYPPILLHRLVGHLSLRACYMITLVMHQVLGLLLLGYLVNLLPMSKRWKIFALCCYAPYTLQPMMSVNYTLFRFTVPLATLMFSMRRRGARLTAVLFALGVIVNLAISPEMGFAFGAGAVAYAVLQLRLEGRQWLLAVMAVPAGAGLFLLAVGRPYLLMLSLFAGGVYNFIVEPVPHILLFLMAAVWLVPRMLAAQIKQNREEAVPLIFLFVLSMTLVPVDFGRADQAHVFFDGIGIFLLSFVAMSERPRWQQFTWGACIALSMLLGHRIVYKFWQFQIQNVIQRAVLLHPTSLPANAFFGVLREVKPGAFKRFQDPAALPPSSFDVDALVALVGGETVATPYVIPFNVEEQLQNRGLYRPDFYDHMIAVLHSSAEDRKIKDFNAASWAVLPMSPEFRESETQTLADQVLGVRLPYKAKRMPYVVGVRFSENLHQNWRVAGTVGEFIVYCNTLHNPRCERS